MDQYYHIMEELNSNIGILKNIYNAGNLSIQNFFKKINIDEIEKKIEQIKTKMKIFLHSYIIYVIFIQNTNQKMKLISIFL